MLSNSYLLLLLQLLVQLAVSSSNSSISNLLLTKLILGAVDEGVDQLVVVELFPGVVRGLLGLLPVPVNFELLAPLCHLALDDSIDAELDIDIFLQGPGRDLIRLLDSIHREIVI